MNWKWFVSRTVRQAAELRKQVWYILHSQRDLLPPKALGEVQSRSRRSTARSSPRPVATP